MSTEENKALVRRFIDEVFNGGKLDASEQYLSTTVVDHNAFPGTPPGIAGSKETIGMIRTAFPDVHLTFDEVITEGDKVVVRNTFTGTNTGAFMGMPATGKTVKVSGMDISRVANGKIVEHWGIQDQLGMMQQLGVIPTPG